MDDFETRPAIAQNVPRPGAHSVAYLLTNYPMLSMIFVVREVLELRRLGFRINVASIHPPDRPIDSLTAGEAEEAARTYCLKRHGIPGAAAAHLFAFFTRPLRYVAGLVLALRLAGLDLRRLFYLLMYFTEALMVGHWMRQKRHTHLHCHLGQQSATIGLLVRAVFRVGYSITVHGPDEFYDARGQYLAEKVAAADFICCISSFARSQLMKVSPHSHWHKLIVARLGVDPRVFSPLPPRTSPDPFEILAVGRFVPAKGQHLLIDAIEQLRLSGHKVRLHLVGAGPDQAALRQRAAESPASAAIVFEGAVSQDRIRDLYAAADIFCLPSFAEGIPVVLMEAMAMGIPCVSTHITGIPELIRNNVDGLLVAPGDAEALAEAIAGLIDDLALRKQFASNARKRILADYDLQTNVARLSEIFIERVARVQ